MPNADITNNIIARILEYFNHKQIDSGGLHLHMQRNTDMWHQGPFEHKGLQSATVAAAAAGWLFSRNTSMLLDRASPQATPN
jgi:hypothetical protein